MALSIGSLILLIVLYHLILSETKCPSAKCNCQTDQIRCFGFESYSELNFPYDITQINILELKPAKSILVDETLKLNGLKVAKQVILHNIKGFSIKKNPFRNILPDFVAEQVSKNGIGLELNIFDSEFEFYESADIKLESMCTRIHLESTDLFDDGVLSKFSKLSFNGNIAYPKNLCPFVFKNAKIDIILTYVMNSSNRFDFKKINDIGDINSTISNFYLFNSKINILDSRILNPFVFRRLKTLHYEGELEQIESNLLGELKELKNIKLDLNNFRQFIMNENKTEWMLDLNKYEDLASTMKNIHKYILMLHLTDKSQGFEYSESDFCLFKNFPSNRYVYPVIKSKPGLSCSCTVMWLIKNYKAYLTPQLLTILKTNSIVACLDIESEEFNRRLDNCRFDEQLFRCDSRRFTTLGTGNMISLNSLELTKSFLTTKHSTFWPSSFNINSDESTSIKNLINKGSGIATEEFENENQKALVRSIAVFMATVGFISISAILGFILFIYK